jgi:hypothetical protein
METGNGSDKAEAEPVAWSAATLFQPIKTLENVLAFIDGDPRAIIYDRNDGTPIILSDLHGHPTGFTAMFDRVVDEVRHGIEQKVPIARYEYSLIQDGIEMRMLVFRGGIE